MRLLFCLGGLVALAALAGCEEEVVRPPDLDATYTLWGALQPDSARQGVRVIPITDEISLGSTDPLPVTVTSLDLETGAETPWRDSVITFSNGTVGHVFLADLQPAYGSRHVFRVADADGTETSALVAVPPLVEPIRQSPLLGVSVDYPVLFPGAPRINRVRATYQVETSECQQLPVERALPPRASKPVEFGWQTVLNLREEGLGVIQTATREGGPLALLGITLTVEVASEDWRPPGGVFDREVLIEPGTLSNVTNGFGFVGSSYTLSVSWAPTTDELARSPFRRPGFGCSAS